MIDDEERRAGPPTDNDIKPKLENKASPVKKLESPVKSGAKRASHNEKKLPKKRQKKEETSEDEGSEVITEESAMSDFLGSDNSESPKAKRKSKIKSRGRPKDQPKKRARVAYDSEDDNISEPSFIHSEEDSKIKSSPPEKAKSEHGKRKRPSKAKVESEDDSTEEQNVADRKQAIKDDDSDSEAAMIIDDEPRLKLKKQSKVEATSSSKASKSKAAQKDLSPDEIQVKTLQSQLTKCGVRKIWGIELKKFGDDNLKKIRHLQGMLRDVGMTGRFSEQRAREIKELRELQADLEAVQEGDSKWGLQSGTRVRAQRKSLREISDEGHEDDEDGNGLSRSDRNVEVKAEDKAARVKQELAFLGDEESDSD